MRIDLGDAFVPAILRNFTLATLHGRAILESHSTFVSMIWFECPARSSIGKVT